MTSFRAVRDGAGPAHDQVRVFVGPDAEHRALAGVLVMSPSQAQEFLRLLRSSPLRVDADDFDVEARVVEHVVLEVGPPVDGRVVPD